MSNLNSLSRGVAVAAAMLAGLALAQPANDLCAGAERITVVNPNTTYTSTTTTNIAAAAATVEAPGFACFTTSVKNSIWYVFTAPAAGNYRIETCAVSNYDTIIQVYSGSTCGTLTTLGSTGCTDHGGGTPRDAAALNLNLGAGEYYVQVASWSSGTVTASSSTALAIRYTPLPGVAVADTCAGTVPNLTVNTPMLFSTYVGINDDSRIGGGQACFVGTGHSTTAADNAAPGRDVVFGFTPGSTGSYNVRLSAPATSLNALVYVTDSCVAAMTPPQTYSPPQCIAAANRIGSTTSLAEDLVCIPMTGGVPYFLWADETALSANGATYEIEVTACFPEIDPNDTPATAQALSCPITGRVNPAGEADFFSLGTNPVGSRAFALVEATSSGSTGSSSSDFDLRITTATDTLEYDDTNADALFGGSSGSIAGTPLPNAPAFARVSHFSATTVLEPYRLHAVVQTGTATAEAEPNDSTATANAGVANYFSGEVTSTTDIDLFAFEARGGDLVFLSLDSQPSRTGSTSSGNHTLQLLNAAGTALVAVNDSGTTVNNTVATGSLTSSTPALPSESLVYRVRTSGTYFARVGRTSSTGTGQYLLSIARDCSPGGGIGAPTVSSISPASGTVLGNETVTITGSGFSSLATVRIGGTLATVTSRSTTSLQVTTPAGNEGVVDVAVSNPGPQTATLTGGFTYIAPIAPPTITSLNPATGPTAGSTVVTLTGTLFKAGAEVRFTVAGDTRQATNVVVVSATQLRATTPAHLAGLATVTVRNPVDALEGSLVDGFTYLAPPTITTINPATGLTSGGQVITIQGTAFRTGATVRFGANAGTNVVVDPSGTSLTVTTPVATVNGPVDVTLVNTDTQQTVATGGFTYTYPTPTITTVTPSSGYAVGGTLITIVGTGFQLNPTVTVGGAPATSVTRTSLTQVTAVTPPGTPGPADVVLTNTDAQSVTRTSGFRYVPAPTIASIAPATGPMQGGTRITITGQNFQQGASVRLGGVPAFAVSVTSATTATAVTNSSAPGAVDVVLTNPDLQTATLTAGYTYEGAPSMTSLSPISGSTAGGTVVTLVGAGFVPNSTVLFGTLPSPTVTRISNTELTAVTPASPVGVVTVTVRNPDNQSAALPGGFRFVAPPTVTAATPSMGDVAGGTVVTITGTGFNAGTSVKFGGTAAMQVSLVSATELAAVTPRHAPGVVDLEVSTDGAAATLTGGFTYTRSAPTLAAVAPVSGPIAGGTLLTLSGTGFAQGASITVGGAAATDVVIVSDVLARAVAPAHAAGVVDVVFTNDDNQSATLDDGFTYVAPPSNNAGNADGGDGSIGQDPMVTNVPGGVSCGCSSFDGSMFSMAGFGLLMVLSRRRRRS